MSNLNEWGVPDWRDAAAYPQPDDLPDRLWRWEFIRRMSDYRSAWDRASKVQYEIECRRAEEAGRDRSKILTPDDLYFVVNAAVWNNPAQYQDLIKYNINPFYNPRVAIPRFFRDGPPIMSLSTPQYGDEYGGYFLLQPEKQHRTDPLSIRPGWTVVHIDLTEPLDIQLDRAKKQLQDVQRDFLEEIDFTDRLKQKSARRQRKNMWPTYLRVLDARNTGASFKVIGCTMNGIDSCDTQSENARISAQKWHGRAIEIANNWAP